MEPASSILDIPYKCVSITRDGEHYERPTALMARDDGYAGEVTITGWGAGELIPGQRYLLSKEKQ